MSKTQDPSLGVHRVVHQRFMDQLEADDAAERFLIAAMNLRDQSPIRPGTMRIRWWNLEGDDGRCGALSDGREVIASVTVTRDDMNWSEVCGVAFV